MNFYENFESFGDKVVLDSSTGELLTYKKLEVDSNLIGEQVISRTLVFMMCDNSVESVVAYLGFLKKKVVVALLNSSMNYELFFNLLSAYRPAYVFIPLNKIELFDGYEKNFIYGDYCLLKTKYEMDYTIHDSLALLLTTSGSTGSPKFVRLSYDNLQSNAIAIAQYLNISGTDRPITTMPMSYSYGLSIINSHILKGASIILNDRTLMEKEFWTAIKDKKATTFGGVPYIYEMLKKLRFERMQLPDLKYMTQAGGRLSPELCSEFTEICEKKLMSFIVMYGQTEATARMSYLPWEYARMKAGSIGLAIPGGRFWLEDESGKIIQSIDTSGELVYQGENVSLGYAESFADLVKGDENNGILRTGDIARKDKDGLYYIVGRKKRFLKVYGNRVNLDELEQILKTEGYDCAVTGEDDKVRIYTTDKDVEKVIIEFISRRTGINQQGFFVSYLNKIPRNESGKIIYAGL